MATTVSVISSSTISDRPNDLTSHTSKSIRGSSSPKIIPGRLAQRVEQTQQGDERDAFPGQAGEPGFAQALPARLRTSRRDVVRSIGLMDEAYLNAYRIAP